MKINRLKKNKLFGIIIGAAALFWFLIRVIPKPSRATYPCQRAAFPIASSFVIYLTSLFVSAAAIRKTSKFLSRKKYIPAIATAVFLLALIIFNSNTNPVKLFAKAAEDAVFVPNTPMGESSGALSGKVIWSWDPDAVDETCPNTWLESENWYMPEYTDQTRVKAMVVNGVKYLSGKNNIQDAWDYLFSYHNRTESALGEGYQEGQKIAIKSNFVTCDASNMDGHDKKENLNMTDIAPQLMWAILDQLVNQVGVAQSDISIGDPSAYFPNQYYEMLSPDFPDVVYLSLEDATGRTGVISSDEGQIKFSDGSDVDYLPTYYVEADYMINMSVVKHHGTAGFSNIAKNHYGSNMRNTASHMHSSLVGNQSGYNYYRHFVDLLGHEHLGGKTILYIGDMLWSSSNAWSSPKIFSQSPFNSDYPSSLLFSTDPVAMESVALDFISNESWDDNLANTAGVDDYLIQLADPDVRPEGISYDPEGDGTVIDYSLGIYEHWNNVESKEYTKNLGTGNGILLLKNFMNSSDASINAPTDLVLDYDTESQALNISWTDNSIDEDGFIIEKSTDGGENYAELTETGADVNLYSDSNVEAGAIQYYRVQTIRGTESSDFIEGSIEFAAEGINSLNISQKNVAVYPLPANDAVTLEFQNQQPDEEIVIQLITTNGSIVMEKTEMLQSDILELDISQLNSGMYIMNIVCGNENIHSQVIPVK